MNFCEQVSQKCESGTFAFPFARIIVSFAVKVFHFRIFNSVRKKNYSLQKIKGFARRFCEQFVKVQFSHPEGKWSQDYQTSVSYLACKIYILACTQLSLFCFDFLFFFICAWQTMLARAKFTVWPDLLFKDVEDTK